MSFCVGKNHNLFSPAVVHSQFFCSTSSLAICPGISIYWAEYFRRIICFFLFIQFSDLNAALKSLVSNKCLWGNLAISCMQQVLIGATGCSALWGIFQLAQQQILSWVSWYQYVWILTVIKVMVDVLLESHLLTSVSNQIQMPLLLFMQDVSVILHHTAQKWPEVCKMTSNNMIAGVVPCFQSWWIWSIKYAVVKQWCLVRAEVPFDFWMWMLPTTIWLLWEWVKVMLCNCFSFLF